MIATHSSQLNDNLTQTMSFDTIIDGSTFAHSTKYYTFMTDFQLRCKEWLKSDHADLKEGLTLCREMPEAAVFVTYANCYDNAAQEREIVKYLSKVVPAIDIYEPPAPKQYGPIQTMTQASKTHLGGDRPAHFSEWAEMMSDGLRAKIDQLEELHMYRENKRHELEKAEEAGNFSKDSMSRLATLVVAYEKKIRSIYAQADAEWEELQGRVVDEDVKKINAQDESEADCDIRKLEKDDTAPVTSKVTKVTKKAESESASPAPVNPLSDEELEKRTYEELLKIDGLTDGQRKFWLDRRIDNAKKYLREKLNPPYKEKKLAKAKEYMADILAAGYELSPKAQESLKAAGLI